MHPARLQGHWLPSCRKALVLVGLLIAGMPGLQTQAQPANARPPAGPMVTYRELSFPRQRTPVEQLPGEGQAEILRLETLLQRAYEALVADSTAAVLPAEQADVVQQAANQAAAVAPAWDQAAYRREAAFYAAEEARRFPAAARP